MFIVGRAKTKEEENIVRNESNLYKDIVQGNFTDLYKLLIYKALNGLNWVTKNCAHVPWVLHSDDDTVLDVYRLMSEIESLEKEEHQNRVFCHIFKHSKVERSNTSKWPVTQRDYPCDVYPSYCAGPCWFTTMKSAQNLLETIPKLEILWVDDVFLTGFVARKAGIYLVQTEMTPFKLKYSEIGSQIAWLNSKADRVAAWEKIEEYYKNGYYKYFKYLP